ncbi:MAG TPA: hypothetical protein VND44_09135 [Acidimicrobiales bacterium]|nr:hypothetical protein [Acidimicrobiales bacterium]
MNEFPSVPVPNCRPLPTVPPGAIRSRRLPRVLAAAAVAVTALTSAVAVTSAAGADGPGRGPGAVRAAVPAGAIRHIVVINLENESYASTFGPGSVATYLNQVLVPKGELLSDYHATGHVSADNYLAEVSGQAPNLVTSSDCITDLSTFAGSFNDVTPGIPDPNRAAYPGQVDGQGCVYPSSVPTIGNQLTAADRGDHGPTWRAYVEDMGSDPARDGGTPDPLGGTDCAHPTQSAGLAADGTNGAEGPNATGSQVLSTTTDQYVDRHNPFIYFHAVTDDAAYCAAHVVPLGTVSVGTGGRPDAFAGHLADDLARQSTTPAFSLITPNVCDDGHDAKCAGTNTDGTTTGGLVGADAWLSHWMPLILGSPAYRDGSMLVTITTDEGSVSDGSAAAGELPGPGSANPGYSPLLNVLSPAYGGKTLYQVLGVTGITPGVAPVAGTLPGGGLVGALLLNARWIRPGTVNAAPYNHYSALRTYEDLLGITTGGSDGLGHLGMAGAAGLAPFGTDVFNARPTRWCGPTGPGRGPRADGRDGCPGGRNR